MSAITRDSSNNTKTADQLLTLVLAEDKPTFMAWQAGGVHVRRRMMPPMQPQEKPMPKLAKKVSKKSAGTQKSEKVSRPRKIKLNTLDGVRRHIRHIL